MKKENRKRSLLDVVILGVVVVIALVVIALSFSNTRLLARELGLNEYLTAGLVEILFASLLFIRGRQRATRRNVPLFLSIGYFTSLGFVTGVNMYGLYQENTIVGPIVGGAISAAMWLMESVLVWLWVDSHRPHRKRMKELKREAKKQIEEIKLKQQLEWMIWEAQKPNLDLIIKARKAEEKRKEIEEEGLPEFFQIREELPLMTAELFRRDTFDHKAGYLIEETDGEIFQNQLISATTAGLDNGAEATSKVKEPAIKEEEKHLSGTSPTEEHREIPKSSVEKQNEQSSHVEKSVTSSSELKRKSQPKIRDVEVVLSYAMEIYRETGKKPTRRQLIETANTTEHYAKQALARLKEVEESETVTTEQKHAQLKLIETA